VALLAAKEKNMAKAILLVLSLLIGEQIEPLNVKREITDKPVIQPIN
jgi:hypothetical protein